jgi:UPF0271 protein
MRVLDASVFIREHDIDGDLASVPEVGAELEGGASFRFDAMEGSGMHLHVPASTALDRVRRAATETGDEDELSNTDVRLLATALELEGTLVTDDYAMQNVADRVGVAVETVARDGITERREWGFQCAGCGREFDDRRDRCPVCGSELTRKNPSD